jgi:hypothetical protein
VLPEPSPRRDRLARFDAKRSARSPESSEHRGDLRPGAIGATTALVMELVEGRHSRTASHGTDPHRRGAADREQICEALEAAHEQGSSTAI